MWSLSGFVKGLVEAANDVRSNVWSVVLIGAGITLVLHGHENVGSSLVTGAFAVFRSSNTETPLARVADLVAADPKKE